MTLESSGAIHIAMKIALPLLAITASGVASLFIRKQRKEWVKIMSINSDTQSTSSDSGSARLMIEVRAMCPYCNMRFSQMAETVDSALKQLASLGKCRSWDGVHTFANVEYKVGVYRG